MCLEATKSGATSRRWAVLALTLAVSLGGAVEAQVLDGASPLLARVETDGPASGIEEAARLLDDHSGSIGVLLQFAELLVETRGVPRARDALVLRRTSLPAAHFEIALASLDRSTGRVVAARQRWSRIDLAALDLDHPLDRLWVELERWNLGAPADSVPHIETRVGRAAARLGGPWTAWARHRLSVIAARDSRDPNAVGSPPAGFEWSRCRALLLRARLHAARGEAEAAESDYRECAEVADAIGARRTGALARSYFGLLLDAQERFRDAASVRAEAVETFETFGDSLALAYASMGLGWDYDRLSQPTESVNASRRALELWEALGNDWGRVQALNNLGVAHFDSDAWEAAGDRFRQALEILDATENPSQRQMVLNNVALLESRRGRPDRAVPIYRELLELHRQSQNRAGERQVLNNLGLACLGLGESEQAREYFRQVIALTPEDEPFPVAAMSNLSMILADEGDLDGAEQLLQNVLPGVRERGQRDAWANVLAWMGRIRQRSGDSIAALRYLARADSLAQLRGDTGFRVSTLVRLATAQLQVGQVEPAVDTARSARRIADALGANSLRAASACLLGLAEEASGDCESAAHAAHDALDIWLEDHREADAAFDRSDITAASAEALRVLVRCGRSCDDCEDVFDELAPMADAILGAEAQVVTLGSSDEVDVRTREERELRSQVQHLRIAVSRSPEDRRSRWRLADAETAWNAARRELAAARGAARPQVQLDLDELRAATEGSSPVCFLAYVMGPTLPGIADAPVLRFYRDRRSARVDLLEDEQILRRRIAAWQSMLTHPSTSPLEREAELRLARSLAKDLLPPEMLARGAPTSWVIAADGALASMSFAALVVEDSPPVRLVERVDLQRARSWSAWMRSDENATAVSGHSVLRAKTDQLAAAARGEADWPAALVLHIDSHGYFDEQRPWLSGLFAEDPRSSAGMSEPFLQQADLPLLAMHHALVTLAACETAEAEDSPLHTSVSSFAWAVREAGARAVLGSSWQVEKGLAAWTTERIYALLSEGSSVAEALARVQRELLADERTADPFYWAGWQVMGDGAQRIDLDPRHAPAKAWAWWVLSASLLALAFVLWRRSTSAA